MMFRQTLLGCSVAAALLVMAGGASASGFALIEQSASGMGNAFAGGAAVAEDASTIFFNPAGMSRLSGKQIAVAAHAIRPSAKFTNTASVAGFGRGLGHDGGDAGAWAVVPNGYFAMEVNPKMRAGVGFNAPFGLQTEYLAGWAGRFQALRSSVETLNINPSVSYQTTDALSLGLGLNYQQVRANLTNAQNFVVGEGLSSLSGGDAAWGVNLGALLDLGDGGRIGIAYRSAISYNLTGKLVVTSPTGAIAVNKAVTAAIKMPDTWSLSYFRAMENKWDVMADVTRTGWSSFRELRVLDAATGGTLSVTPENWRDTWRVALGSNYHYNDQWIARMGIAYDQTGVTDAFRTARIPDANRTWLSLGGQYKPSQQAAIDFGYSHLFVNGSNINQNLGVVPGTLAGTYNNSVDIFSMQYTHSF